jgi:hypothetical protein
MTWWRQILRKDVIRGAVVGCCVGGLVSWAGWAVMRDRTSKESPAIRETAPTATVTNASAKSREKMAKIDAWIKERTWFLDMDLELGKVQMCSYPSPRGGGLLVYGVRFKEEDYHWIRSFAYAGTEELECDIDLQVSCPAVPGGDKLPISAAEIWPNKGLGLH